ncbi:hypothetical protein BGZ51_006984 [Haplosporangium sp. Z 767]|nr:hypothetical protein BGZ51_006984 [Haplosporangium sp. Z 767]KAF9192125.1 hypothetical protein BGZ50_008768 [Haplosporangium sp. Z 11]
MERMTVRSREAPMDWEREQDRNQPSIFSTPHPSDFDASKDQRTVAFGSLSANHSRLQKDSSFSSQSSQSSFVAEGWGSTMPKPFRQDSQLSSASGSTAATTLRRDSTFNRQESFLRPQSSQQPSLATSGSFASVSSGSNLSSFASSNRHREGGGGGEVSPAFTTNAEDAQLIRQITESFDMGSLKCDVPDQQRRAASAPSLIRQRNNGSSQQLSRNRFNNSQYRSNTLQSSTWSDDDDDSEDQETGSFLERDVQPHLIRRDKSWSSSEEARATRTKTPRSGLERSRSQSHLQGRVWSENVDLPFILSGYVQVAMNTVFAAVLVYIITNFIMAIQSDISHRSESLLTRERQRIATCREEYFETYRCHLPIGSALVHVCEERKACMGLPDPRIGRASVAAETFALIVNAFVNTMSYKTMAFVVVIVFGGLYFSNQAISSYRSNHILHHQHSLIRPDTDSTVRSSTKSSTSDGSNKRNISSAAKPWAIQPSSHEDRGRGRRELSFGEDLSTTQGTSGRVSRNLMLQHAGSLQRVTGSDDELDMDM